MRTLITRPQSEHTLKLIMIFISFIYLLLAFLLSYSFTFLFALALTREKKLMDRHEKNYGPNLQIEYSVQLYCEEVFFPTDFN